MTTIAWDGKTIAADRQEVEAGVIGPRSKLFEKGDAVIGVSGDIYPAMLYVDWYGKKAKYPIDVLKGEDFELLIIKSGKAYTVNSLNSWLPVENKFYAIGSGNREALAAMMMGATAEEAVAIAARIDNDTNDDIDVIEL